MVCGGRVFNDRKKKTAITATKNVFCAKDCAAETSLTSRSIPKTPDGQIMCFRCTKRTGNRLGEL